MRHVATFARLGAIVLNRTLLGVGCVAEEVDQLLIIDLEKRHLGSMGEKGQERKARLG